jgi:hypothetical protein
MKRFALGAALAAAMTAALPAHAERLSTPSSTIGIDVGTRLNLGLSGNIASRCLLSGGGDIRFGELRGGEAARAAFGLDCNVPFTIDIRSAKGGLAHTTLPGGQGPFAGTLEYDMRLVIPTVSPQPVTVEGRFTSRELMGRRSVSSGDGISAGNGLIEFQMRQPEGAGLLAGDYNETVTLTITPRM